MSANSDGPSPAARVRLDKWLWAARLFKTRSLAHAAIELGRVRVDGERIKAAREARVGEKIEVQVGDVRIEVVIRALSSVRGPASAARLLYEETAASAARRAQRALASRPDPAAVLKGRPTKKEGRSIRRLTQDG